jgi:hypothetical protein
VIRRAATLAAFVLALCFVLPLSTCTRYVDGRGEAVEVAPGRAAPEGVTAIVDRQIAAEQLRTNPLGGFLMLVAFLGPLAAALHARFGRGERTKRVLFWLQPLFLLFAGHAVWVIANFGEPAIGAWLAPPALAVLGLDWLLALARPAPS